jgi:Domain of unknown function (DUF4389)
MATPGETYPARFAVDYPEKCDRLTTLLRIPIIIPVLIILGLVSGASGQWESLPGWRVVWGGGGFIFLATVLMLVIRRKYPRWWFDWNLELTRFAARVLAYLAVLTHQYPSTDEEQSVHVQLAYPDAAKDLNRWLPLVKWLLALPHVVVLAVLNAAVIICTVIAWFAILATGKYPRGIFSFVVAVMKWDLRVAAYALFLVTDVYPPFSL